MVIVHFGSHPVAANAANDPTSLPAYRALANYLIARGEPQPLLGKPWQVKSIGGREVMASNPPRLRFLPDGRLAGHTGCNRLAGQYRLEQDALTIESLSSTRVAYPQAPMEQEHRLMQKLPNIERYSLEADSTLTLHTADGGPLTAHRATP